MGRKWICVKTKIPSELTIGKTYETDDKGYGITFDTGVKGALSICGYGYEPVGSKFVEIKEEEKIMEFKVGDLLKIIDGRHGHDFKVGEIVKVLEVGKYDYRVIGTISNSIWYVKEDEVVEEDNQKSIHITTKGTTTHAVLKDGKEVIKRASVGLHYEDEYKFETGVMEVVKKLLDVPKYEEVVRQAKVGDVVKIITDFGHYAKVGTIGEVTRVGNYGYLDVKVNKKTHCLNSENYVVLVPIKNESLYKQLSDYTTDELLEEIRIRSVK